MPRLYCLGLEEIDSPFECGNCKERFETEDDLESHQCYYQYQCGVCQKRFGTMDMVNSGEHRFKRRSEVVNCNDYFVHITVSGKRVIKNKKTEYNLKEMRKRKREETELVKMLKSPNTRRNVETVEEIPVIIID